MKYVSFVFLILVIAACSRTSKPISYGSDKCEFCSMIISDENWGGEIVTKKGKVYFFDSIECLAYYYSKSDSKEQQSFELLLTVNYLKPGELIDAPKAHYLKSPKFHSPMGLNIASLK